MTRNITLLSNNDIDGLQLSKSVGLFHLMRTVSNRLFLCLSVNFYYYLTKNHNNYVYFT